MTSDLAIAVGERTGMFLEEKNVKELGNWVFVRDPEYPGEIECYANENSIIWECWTAIDESVSPFGTRNKSVLQKTLETLDRDYKNYLGEIGCDENI